MKIISAIDYTFRKVVRVLLNDAEPQWVHEDEEGKRTPAPDGHTGNTDEGKEACSECRNNWNVFEALFDGDAFKNKTDMEIIAETLDMAEASIAQKPREMSIR